MKYHSIVIGILATIGLLLIDDVQAGERSLVSQRMSRWRDNSIQRHSSSQSEPNPQSAGISKSGEELFSDLKVNIDNSASTFNQRNSDIAHFADGRGVVVWEDERNGIWRIAAQPLSLAGTTVGPNKFLDSGNPPATLRQARVAANAAGVVVIVYVKESDHALYCRTYDFGLSSGGSEFRIDDATPGNYVNQPDIALLSGSRFVVVWEDSRNGSNIYAQILSSTGALSGGNFQINASLASPYRIAPAVVSTLAGDFAVVWEDGRSGNGDVYFRIFTDVGTPLFPELLIDAGFASDYQFMPKIEFLKGSGYLAAWISDRDGGQSIFAQLVSTSSVPLGATFRVNDAETDVCWDLNLENAADSGAVCVWAEYSNSASIEAQKISKTAVSVGGNIKIEDSGLLRERAFPAIARSGTNFTAVWVDQRNENLDIYAQRLSSILSKANANYKLNDDVNGAQQLTPDVAGITANSLGIVWHDRKSDQGDITLQLISSIGAPLGASIKINGDVGSAVQKNPRIGAAPNGPIWTVWEDARTSDGLQGQNIIAQRLNGTAVPQGSNLVVNDDGTARPKSNPDLDVAADGKVCFVWIDERDDSRQVYAQGFSSVGSALGANVPVTADLGMIENLEPHVGVRNDGSFVVAWLSIVNDKTLAYFRQFSNMNQPAGPARMVQVDTASAQIVDIDISVHKSNQTFYVSTIEQEGGSTNVKLYGYDQGGNLIVGPVVVTDAPGNYADVRAAIDVSNAISIIWTAESSSGSRNMLQIMRNDGFALGSNRLVSSNSANRVEVAPSTAMIGGFFYSVWADNRNSNAGFDIFVNSVQYTSTDVDDEVNITLPAEFTLGQNYPNPFNPETVISYSLEKPNFVTLTVYNVLGQELDRLVDDYQTAGRYEVRWNYTASSFRVASGVYFYRLTVGGRSVTKKMILLK